MHIVIQPKQHHELPMKKEELQEHLKMKRRGASQTKNGKAYTRKKKAQKERIRTMNVYEVITSQNGNPTVYADNKFAAWEQATSLFVDVLNVVFVRKLV